MIKNMDKVQWIMIMGKFTKGCGKMTRCTDKGSIFPRVAMSTKEDGGMVRCTDKGNLFS